MLPVGVTIMFADNLDHSNHAGRTWERTSIGRVPVGIDTTQTEFDTIGKTGGAKTHVLSQGQLPIVSGTIAFHGAGGGSSMWHPTGVFSSSGIVQGKYTGWWNETPAASSLTNISMNFGNNQAHNNLQPYEVFAFWKRTA